MAILVTNDDGIDAPGLAALVDALTGLDQLVVSAPATNQSGVGMGISLNRDLHPKQHDDAPNGTHRYSITGTPADAVKYGLQHALQGIRPRLVVSGVNLGPNLGRNIRSSGTVSAAFEAVTSGIPAVAVSVDYVIPTNWNGAKHYARMVVDKALAMAEDAKNPFLLNLNVPSRDAEEIPGLIAARHGLGGINDILVSSDNGKTYRLDADFVQGHPSGDCDTAAFMAGYAVVTPMQYDLTDHAFLSELRRTWQDCLSEREDSIEKV